MFQKNKKEEVMTRYIAKRIYDSVDATDGYRVLVDRLWPRGISKERATLDEWAKGIAPSTELRKWFGHDPEKFTEFVKRYKSELEINPEFSNYKKQWSEHKTVTLLYAAKNTTQNEAVVLQKILST